MSGGRCGAELGKKIMLGDMDICGNSTIWFCDECGSYFCDLHIGQQAGEKGLNSQDLCIKCKEKMNDEGNTKIEVSSSINKPRSRKNVLSLKEIIVIIDRFIKYNETETWFIEGINQSKEDWEEGKISSRETKEFIMGFCSILVRNNPLSFVRCKLCDSENNVNPGVKNYRCSTCKGETSICKWPFFNNNLRSEPGKLGGKPPRLKQFNRFEIKWKKIPEERRDEILRKVNTSAEFEEHYFQWLKHKRRGRYKPPEEKNKRAAGADSATEKAQYFREIEQNFSETSYRETDQERNKREIDSLEWIKRREYYWIMFNRNPSKISLIGLSLCLLYPPIEDTIDWLSRHYNSSSFEQEWPIEEMKKSKSIIEKRISLLEGSIINAESFNLGTSIPREEIIDLEGIPKRIEELISKLDN